MSFSHLADNLRRRALQYPDTYEESPWGERVVKVNQKIFLFMHAANDQLSVTVRLPRTGFTVLAAPFAEPAGYGLARSGWVSLTFTDSAHAPHKDLLQWIDESYRAVAPAGLVKTLPGGRTASPAT